MKYLEWMGLWSDRCWVSQLSKEEVLELAPDASEGLRRATAEMDSEVDRMRKAAGGVWPAGEFETLRQARQSEIGELVRRKIRELNQYKYLTEKKTMTRDQASNTLAVNAGQLALSYRDAFLDCAEALGLIKFDEPKTPKTPFEKLTETMGDGHWSTNNIMCAIDSAGLKIVEK